MTNFYADQVMVNMGDGLTRLVFGADKELSIKVYLPTNVVLELRSVILQAHEKLQVSKEKGTGLIKTQ